MDKKLNQVELMKQFVGTWKGDFGNETIFIGNNKQFGNGLICTSQIITKGEVVDSITQLFGFDNKVNKFIIAELKESSPNIEICSAWFSSKTKGEIVISNPENAPYKFRFEFKTPDMIIQTAIKDGKTVNEITLFRDGNNINK
jgi:hypothetical protein